MTALTEAQIVEIERARRIRKALAGAQTAKQNSRIISLCAVKPEPRVVRLTFISGFTLSPPAEKT